MGLKNVVLCLDLSLQLISRRSVSTVDLHRHTADLCKAAGGIYGYYSSNHFLLILKLTYSVHGFYLVSVLPLVKMLPSNEADTCRPVIYARAVLVATINSGPMIPGWGAEQGQL